MNMHRAVLRKGLRIQDCKPEALSSIPSPTKNQNRKNSRLKPGVLEFTTVSSTWDAEAGGHEFKTSLNYTAEFTIGRVQTDPLLS
jgi:hypothetical protein